MLIEWGCMPSVFFRFPGLLADSAAYDSVLCYGLIPLGSDAWLAKGEIPAQGSIVLVHANGNEPQGLDHLLALIEDARRVPAVRKLNFLDLRRTLIDKKKYFRDESPDTSAWWRSGFLAETSSVQNVTVVDSPRGLSGTEFLPSDSCKNGATP
jgi:hypothetical protein